MSSGYLRPLASARDDPQQKFSPQPSRPPRPYVPVACSHCRLKKARCDGLRPTCTRCSGLQLACKYDVTQGVSRAERFKLQKQRQSSITSDLTSLVHALRSGSDLEATTVLARLRLGESVEDIVQSLNTNLDEVPETAQSSDEKHEDTLNLDSFAHPSCVESIANQLEKLPTTGVPPDVTSNAREVSIAASASQFLCIIFEREEFRLPASSKEDASHVDESTVSPTNLKETQHKSSKTQSHSIDDATPSLHSIHQHSPSHVTAKSIATPFSGKDARRLRGSWATYPETRHSLTTAQSFLNDPMTDYPHSFSIASLRGLTIPLWAMPSVNNESGSGSMNSAFSSIQEMAATLIREGTSQEQLFGICPNVAALYNQEEYKKSCILSQWAASMVHSVKLKGYDFTCFASMYLFWYLMRWMLFPSQATYEAIPQWLRPTPNQLFIPHIQMLDFIIWPKFREFAVSTPPMQEKMDWLMDMATHIKCQWPFPLEEAIRKDEKTGHTVLTDQAEHLAIMSNWSLAPSFRAYVPNADLYVSIRSEDE